MLGVALTSNIIRLYSLYGKNEFAKAAVPAFANVATPAFAPLTKMSFAVLGDELDEGCIAVVGVCLPVTLFDICDSLTPLASLEGGTLSSGGKLLSSSNSASIIVPSDISWSPTSLSSLLASSVVDDVACLPN